jgi:hypothetical protein
MTSKYTSVYDAHTQDPRDQRSLLLWREHPQYWWICATGLLAHKWLVLSWFHASPAPFVPAAVQYIQKCLQCLQNPRLLLWYFKPMRRVICQVITKSFNILSTIAAISMFFPDAASIHNINDLSTAYCVCKYMVEYASSC